MLYTFKIFNILGMSKDEIEKDFGFLLNAFKCGAPPHGGIAFGFDRLISILTNEKSIRDTIAFPKNNGGLDSMLNAPGTVDSEQLKELGLKID
ncbi:MAG: amino acid--tRNA ligase-related protein [Solitalea-like symbiont of Acarus siro]